MGGVEVCLVEADCLAHRRLDVQRLDVLPVFLEQRDEEVDALGAEVNTRISASYISEVDLLIITLDTTCSSVIWT